MITQDRLRQLLTYDPRTGIFVRNSTGKIAGTVTKDKQKYIRIAVDNEKYYAQQLAFVWMTGSKADNQPDHINGNGTDNRWCNLRNVTASENCRNRRLKANNRSGINGVRQSGKKWEAYIKVNGKTTRLGRHNTKEQAAKARRAAELKIGGFSKTHGLPRELHGHSRN